MAGPRQAEFAAARRRQGIERQAVWVQQTPEGPREILLIETADPAHAFAEMATSQDPFHAGSAGCSSTPSASTSPRHEGPPPEQVLDWSAWARRRGCGLGTTARMPASVWSTAARLSPAIAVRRCDPPV